ncbi:MAG: hypothetical protein K2I76_04060 [Malacoplasma sp.]|nr:hypothetical protein [Malacoplasma sp.]
MENFDNNTNEKESFTESTNDSNKFETDTNQNEQLICLGSHKGKKRGGGGHVKKCDKNCLVPLSVYKQQLIENGEYDPENKFVCKYLKSGNVPFNHLYCSPICFLEAKYLPKKISIEEAKGIKSKAISILVLTIIWVVFAIVSIVVASCFSGEISSVSAIALGCIAALIWLIKNIIVIVLKGELNIRSFFAPDYQDYTEPAFITRSFSKNFKLTGLLIVPLSFQFIWSFVSGGGFFWTIFMLFAAIALSFLILVYSIVSSIFYGLYISIYLIKNVKADA